MRYLEEERETILRYDPIDQKWYAWTTYPPHIRKLTAQGWTVLRQTESEGLIIDSEFSAPKNAVTIRDLTKLDMPNRYRPEKGKPFGSRANRQETAISDDN